MADLSRAIENTWEDETIDLGDTIRVYDNDITDLNGDTLNVGCRVKKITKNLLDPADTTVEINNISKDITTVQATLEKKLKYAMPYNDNPRIIDANAIQKGYIGGDVG
jgi:hypothetical protein